jgi:hypothetical protein
MSKELYVVHCIDTEGPLHESLEATFERLEAILGRRLEPSRATLDRIRRRELDLGGQEDLAALITSPQLLDYNDTWDKVDAMLDELLSPAFRAAHADGRGGGWVYSWFAVDHVGYVDNPRRRDIGYHNVFDHYRARLRASGSTRDELQFHFHPMSTYREAHVCATSYLNSPHLLETLARRIVDRSWFPSCFRPGFHAERPDAHWFLEQWLPFDFANQAMPGDATLEQQRDLAAGRLGDWRRAPSDWSHYRPSHDDYQTPGDARRTIFRCLNVGTRLRLLDEAEVRRAFERADGGAPTVLAFTDHDFRDMRPDVAATHALLRKVAADFPEVDWRHAGAREAARAVLGRDRDPPLELTARLQRVGPDLHLHVEANHDTFGPQPFLAVRTHDKRYLTDNWDLQVPRRSWSYVFDASTILPASIDRIGIAANDLAGHTHVLTLDADGTVRSGARP